MLTIRMKDCRDGSLKKRLFDWTYKMSHLTREVPRLCEMRERIQECLYQAWLRPTWIHFVSGDECPMLDNREFPAIEKPDEVLLEKNPEKFNERTKVFWTTIVHKGENGATHEQRIAHNAYNINNIYVYPTIIHNQDGCAQKIEYMGFVEQLGKWFSFDDIYRQIKQTDPENIKVAVWTGGALSKYPKIVIRPELAKEHDRLKKKYDRWYWLERKIYKVLHTLDSMYLSVKFPFLYPRNRFSGLHHTDWKLSDKIRNLYMESTVFVHVREPMDESQVLNLTDSKYQKIFGQQMFPAVQSREHTSPDYTEYYIVHKDKEYYVAAENKTGGNYHSQWVKVGDEKFVYVPKMKKWLQISKYKTTREVAASEHSDDGFTSYMFTMILDPWKYRKMQFLEWWHKNPVQWFYCIPDHNELDGMEYGWRYAFGWQLITELKEALLKDGGKDWLHRYRITDIKEKWGYLVWDDCGYTPTVKEVLSKYEKMSGHTCIVCGTPAKYFTTGYECPYCAEHLDSHIDPLDCYEFDETGKIIREPVDEEDADAVDAAETKSTGDATTPEADQQSAPADTQEQEYQPPVNLEIDIPTN